MGRKGGPQSSSLGRTNFHSQPRDDLGCGFVPGEPSDETIAMVCSLVGDLEAEALSAATSGPIPTETVTT